VIEILDSPDDAPAVIDLVDPQDAWEERKASPARRERKRQRAASDDRKLPAPSAEVVDLSDDIQSDVRVVAPRRRQRRFGNLERTQESSSARARAELMDSSARRFRRRLEESDQQLAAQFQRQEELRQRRERERQRQRQRQREQQRQLILQRQRHVAQRNAGVIGGSPSLQHAMHHFAINPHNWRPAPRQPSDWMVQEAYSALAAVQAAAAPTPRRSRGSRGGTNDARLRIALQQGDFGPEHYELLQQLDEGVDDGAKDALIRALPARTVAAKEAEKLGDCAICMEKMAARQKVTTLPCLHMYHTRCIGRWLKEKAVCPLCKMEIR